MLPCGVFFSCVFDEMFIEKLLALKNFWFGPSTQAFFLQKALFWMFDSVLNTSLSQ